MQVEIGFWCWLDQDGVSVVSRYFILNFFSGEL